MKRPQFRADWIFFLLFETVYCRGVQSTADTRLFDFLFFNTHTYTYVYGFWITIFRHSVLHIEKRLLKSLFFFLKCIYIYSSDLSLVDRYLAEFYIEFIYLFDHKAIYMYMIIEYIIRIGNYFSYEFWTVLILFLFFWNRKCQSHLLAERILRLLSLFTRLACDKAGES